MDARIRAHAEIIVDHSTRVVAGDAVLIQAPPVASDLVVALYEACGERGAHPTLMTTDSRAMRAYLRAVDPESFAEPPHVAALIEASDVLIGVWGDTNTHEMGDVPPAVNAAFAGASKPINELAMSKRWVATQFPAPGNAQLAEMSRAAYEDFVWNAVNKDWAGQREFQDELVQRLDPAREVRIRSGDTTDLTMSIAGMVAVNDFAERNLPGGEVFTAPVPDSVEGEVLFDLPVVTQGREVTGVHLVFEAGEVVEHSAEKNEDLLAAVLDTDEGAKRLGELGIGMNRDIDRFTRNMLFDEKMGDTVHMALGKAIPESVGEGREGNDSAVHMDMIVDMSEDSSIELDGTVVQQDGTFVFEE
jgi:aminopeptidase